MPKLLEQDIPTGDILHEWTLKEYHQHERGSTWYIVMITFGIILVLYGVISKNFLFSLIIILAAIILFLQSHQEAPDVPFAITELGVVINNRFYPFSELEDFYIIYQPPEVKTLFIHTKSTFRPTLRIPLMDNNPMEIRQTLREYLPENTEKEEEPLADTIARRWKLQ
ncbi:MAG TPA: hypothetical protein VEA18_01290 [Candidatus Kapabacteria bacterium]|nr:hypothetical protein [Candidatus Kapabacteria bacterium]